MKGGVKLIEANKEAICLDVLKALPEWFGLPQAITDYARAVEELPMFGVDADGEIVGFLPLEIIPTLWNADNPCLLMVKALREADHS